MKTLLQFLVLVPFLWNQAMAQWNTSGTNIYNTNAGNVGIGTDGPSTLLHAAKNMTEPTITVQNQGGFGGATYSMIDDASGANWKFKATLQGGFKIRDHANGLDILVIEQNCGANLLYLKSGGSLGIGTSAPAASALVDMSSTSKGLLIPRMTQAQIEAIDSPEDGLQVYCITDGKLYLFVALVNQWKEIAYGSSTILPPGSCGTPMTKIHSTGPVAPVDKTVVYNTVGNIPGELDKCWITSNLGADQEALYAEDISEPAAGWYWQFNRMQGYKHDGTWRTPNTTWNSLIDENLNWESSNDPCQIELGTTWHVPTQTEWTNVDQAGGWSSYTDIWNSPLKMHLAGYLYYSNGNLTGRGTFGVSWTSTKNSNQAAYLLNYDPISCSVGPGGKSMGLPVRCVREAD